MGKKIKLDVGVIEAVVRQISNYASLLESTTSANVNLIEKHERLIDQQTSAIDSLNLQASQLKADNERFQAELLAKQKTIESMSKSLTASQAEGVPKRVNQRYRPYPQEESTK